MLLPYQEIVIWSLILAFIVTLVHRFLVDPDKMRQLKKDMKFLSKKSREAQKKGDTKKSNEYMSEMMGMNKKQLSMMKKPLIIIFLVYGIALYTIFVPYGQTNILTGSQLGGIMVNTENEINEFTRTGVLERGDLSYPARVVKENYNENGQEKTRFNLTINYNQNNDFSDESVLNVGDVITIGDSNWKLHTSNLEKSFFIVSVRLPFTVPSPFGPPIQNLDWVWWYILVIILMSTVLRKLMGVE